MNKFNMGNNMRNTGNDVHKMPIKHTDEIKKATVRDVGGNKISPQSDTDNVKISRDTVTDAVFPRN